MIPEPWGLIWTQLWFRGDGGEGYDVILGSGPGEPMNRTIPAAFPYDWAVSAARGVAWRAWVLGVASLLLAPCSGQAGSPPVSVCGAQIQARSQRLPARLLGGCRPASSRRRPTTSTRC